MKKALLLLFAVSLTCVTHSQITITSPDLPSSGDTLRYSEADIPDSLDYLTTGASHTWDFSQLQPISQGIEQYRSAFSINPVYNLFFGLTAFGRKNADTISLGVATITDVYDFYNKNQNVYKITGRGYEFNNIPTPVNYSDDDEVYTLPLEYNDYDSTTFYVDQTLPNLGSLIQYGSRVNHADGWGTITTPYGTFPCLRVKTTVYQTDSVYISQFGFGFAIQRQYYEYKWMADYMKIPALEVTVNLLNGNTFISRIRYRDQYRNLADIYAPQADFTASDTVVFNSQIVQFTNLTNPYPNNIFQWSFSPNAVTYMNGTGANSEHPQAILYTPGYYSVTLQVFNPYGQDTVTKTHYIEVLSHVGLEEETAATSLHLFPNPVQDILYVQTGNTGEKMILLTDMQGKILWHRFTDADNESIPVLQLAAGTYQLMTVQKNTGAVTVEKFIKR